MSYFKDLVRVEVDDGVATLTLNRPDQGNGLSLELVQQLSAAVARVDADDDVRCVLLTGSGRFFCVGGDINAFKAAGDQVPFLLKQVTGHLHVAISRLARMRKPIVTAVNGPAAGAGLGLAVLGDIVIAAQSAHFSMAYTAVGLTPDGGTSMLLPRLIGLRLTQELALTNRRVGFGEALQIGLINRALPDADLMDDARQQAAALANGPVKAFAAVRDLLMSGFDQTLEGQLELESRAIAEASARKEGIEGVAAFLEKRPPMFRQA